MTSINMIMLCFNVVNSHELPAAACVPGSRMRETARHAVPFCLF